jgi:hypothetical protein
MGFLAAAFVVMLCAAAGAAGEKGEERANATAIPASSVQFYLVKPDKEKRSGLYAVGPSPTPIVDGTRTITSLFSDAADGKTPKPVADSFVTLVGKLPGTVREDSYDARGVTDFDSFSPGPGSVQGNEIDLPVTFNKFAAGIGVGRAPEPRDVYVVARLPILPAGKYKATIRFQCVLLTNGGKINAPPETPVLAPLICEFEVRATVGGGAAAKADGNPLEAVTKRWDGLLAAMSKGDMAAVEAYCTPQGRASLDESWLREAEVGLSRRDVFMRMGVTWANPNVRKLSWRLDDAGRVVGELLG